MEKNIAEIRLINLQKVINEFSPSPGNRAAFCRAHGLDPAQLGQYFTGSEHGRKMGERKAREIETAASLPPGFLDQVESERDHHATMPEAQNQASHNGAPITYETTRPNHALTAEETTYVRPYNLVYCSAEELAVVTAMREADKHGYQMIVTAAKNAPRDLSKLKAIKNAG